MDASCVSNHHMFSDASGSFGCGAWWKGLWFQLNGPKTVSWSRSRAKSFCRWLWGVLLSEVGIGKAKE